MDRGRIARRYAAALWMHAAKRGREDEVYRHTHTLLAAFARYPALHRVLASRMVAAEKKERALATLLGESHAGSPLQRFLHVLIGAGREEHLRDVCLSYQSRYRREKKLLTVSLTTAQPISEALAMRLRQRGEQLTGHTISFTATVNPAIGGGYLLRWGTYRIDASVAGRLQQVRHKMLE